MKDPLATVTELHELLDIESFREVCRSFSELYGIGIKIFDGSDKKLVDVRAATGDHCGYLFSVHPTRVMCTNLVNQVRTCPLDGELGQDPRTQVDCFSGLRYKILPITHDSVQLGRVIFGPYAPQGLSGPPSELAQYEKDGLNISTLSTFLEAIPRAGGEAVDKVLNHIQNVLDVILHTGYKSYVTSQLHIASITGAFEDVEKTNRSLQDANDRLKEFDRMKSNFIATVSHELRTPLTSVIGYSEMLLEGMAGQMNPEQREYVNTILEKGESLLMLIGQVLDLSRIESGNVVIVRDEVDPRAVFQQSISDVHPQASRRNLTIDVDVAADVVPIVVDADKIRRVITNLLGNAVKFTSPGGTINVTAKLVDSTPPGAGKFDIFEPERNRHLQIEVIDSGVGIPEDQIDRVFDSFFQVDSSSTREFGGTGLGLSIVRNFVLAHGGTVEVSSTVGVGTTFTVLLPYRFDSPAAEVGLDGITGSRQQTG